MKLKGLLFIFFVLGLYMNLIAQDDFITVWKTDNNNVNSKKINYPGIGINYTLYWKKEDEPSINGTVTVPCSDATNPYTITFPQVGTYVVKYISGTGVFMGFSHEYNVLYNSPNKLIDVKQWGNVKWEILSKAFSGCKNMQMSATDAPDLSRCEALDSMFLYAEKFNSNINNWDLSNIKDISFMFSYAKIFNQELNNWNVSNVINMMGLFFHAEAFNQELNNWNVSNVENMEGVFADAIQFNQPLNNWNVSSATSMYYMFGNAKNFNQPLNNWNTSNVTNMKYMFWYARAFNQPLNNWNTEKVANMQQMFWHARAFNQHLGNWNLNQLNNAKDMLNYCGIDCPNYSETLLGWSNNTNTPNNINFGAIGRKYSDVALIVSARNNLINNNGWTISGDAEEPGCSPLPIKLYSFSVEQVKDVVYIDWVSLCEINNCLYAVYKSKDGKNWELLDEIQGAGNSREKRIYCLEDNNPYLGTTYYKLTQTDFDGTTQELGVRMVQINEITNNLKAYPNPTAGILTIQVKYNDINSLRVLNILGVVVTNHVNIISVSPSQIKLDFNDLERGTYFIQIDNKVAKIIKK